MCLHYYYTHKSIKSRCAHAVNFLNFNSGTKFKKAGLFMKNLSQYVTVQTQRVRNLQLHFVD